MCVWQSESLIFSRALKRTMHTLWKINSSAKFRSLQECDSSQTALAQTGSINLIVGAAESIVSGLGARASKQANVGGPEIFFFFLFLVAKREQGANFITNCETWLPHKELQFYGQNGEFFT